MHTTRTLAGREAREGGWEGVRLVCAASLLESWVYLLHLYDGSLQSGLAVSDPRSKSARFLVFDHIVFGLHTASYLNFYNVIVIIFDPRLL